MDRGAHIRTGKKTKWQQSEGVEGNREKLLDFCRQHNLQVMNTRFAKTPAKLATWRAWSTKHGDPLNSQLEYILIEHRWKNGVRNIEANIYAKIDSDHAPVMATCQFKLKAIGQRTQTRPQLLPLGEDEKEEFNRA